MATGTRAAGRPEYYDDPDFNYEQWWNGRRYEHLAEVIAIRRLLDGRRFGSAVDVGGGYGRLSVVLADYADKVTLTDPSSQQLDLARTFLAPHPSIESRRMSAARLEFPEASTDLVTQTVASQLEAVGLQVRSLLSVSNLRHPLIKEFLPERAMLAIERAVQEPLADLSFGPSMFFLAQK